MPNRWEGRSLSLGQFLYLAPLPPRKSTSLSRDSADEIVHVQLANDFVVERNVSWVPVNTEFCERGLSS